MELDKENIKKAKEAFKAGNFPRALDIFSKLNLSLLPPKKRSDILYLFAVALHETGDREQAIRKVKEAISFTPHHALALSALGNFLSEEGRLHAAIAQYRAAVKADPNLWEPYFQWGYILKKMGSAKAALRKFKAALENKSDHAEIYIHAGDCAFQLDRFKDALSYYKLAKKHGGGSIDLSSRIGNTYLNMGNREEAIEAYKECVALDPLDGLGYENWGLMLHQEGKLVEAAAKYEQGLLHDPESPTLQLRHGEVLVQMEKYKEAMLPLEKALSILLDKAEGEWGLQWSPILADCAYMLGYVYGKLGSESKAKDFYKLALRYAPDHLDVLQQIAAVRGVYREHHVAWEFVLEGKVDSDQGKMKGLRAYRVAALTMDEAMKYVKDCEEDILENVKPKDVTRTEQVASYAGVLARGPLFLLTRGN